MLSKFKKIELQNESGKVTEIFSWKNIFTLTLLPVRLLWKLLDFIHLITFVMFGGLIFYIGGVGLLENPWVDTALYLIIGAILIVAPILFLLDKGN